MSEADTPKIRSSEEGWATVEFPGTMTIETLGRSGTEPDAPDDPPDLESAIATIEELRQREAQLVQRVRDLETQLERMKAAERNASAPVEEITSFASDRSRDDRQRLLVDAIRNKLNAYQERILQMEQEQALTQQRYQEKTHQLQQIEHTCQELRSRLQRQQRHALQFKAALEKCLEAEAQQRSTPNSDRPSAQFLFSSSAHTPPPSFSPPLPKTESTESAPSAFSIDPDNGDGNPPEFSANAPTNGKAPEMETLLNGDQSERSADDDESDEDFDLPENSPSLFKRQSLANLDLPSFPRLS
ncbi:MAG TPA: hypothetical protein IGS17_14890 [Oscillatoriales cyanobacterium M59_W2019_021]|nr:MAG: hypothetical protein D6728_00335 [Cyanobacteria bacterium J055]HIK32577.1 hypothetical protein [Oscillatoriales cyanobacterium M4454_W2019_049]HIK52192.1 hypothetical protein [Oscillatoriales cyanobacterium M59_W2019_021]